MIRFGFNYNQLLLFYRKNSILEIIAINHLSKSVGRKGIS